MSYHDEAINHATGLDVPKAQEKAAWVEWVEKWYKYDPKAERKLRKRMPDTTPEPQSPEELADLAGLQDREMAWFLARAWFVIRDRERRRRSAATRMPTQQAQQTRSDLFASLDNDAYDREVGYG